MKQVNKNKTIAFITLGLVVLVGAYNAVVINSGSHLTGSEVKFSKRLDEVLGVTIEGRKVASETKWQKLAAPTKMVEKTIAKVTAPVAVSAPIEAPKFVEPEAAVKETLSLSLVEVINPKLWANGLNNTQFAGSIATNEGVIENLEVNLPEGASFSANFSEMTGNVFEYEMNGQNFSGMMYQVDQNAYMVTLTNGPLEGTRFRFAAEAPAVEQQHTQEMLAERNNVEMGNFGAEQVENFEAPQTEEVAAQGNFQSVGFNL